MADSIYTFDPTAASNTALDSIAYGPNQLYHSNIDNWMRSAASKIAQFVDDLGGVNTVGGTANAITVTIASGITAYATGQLFWFKNTPGPNTSATTINVNSIGDKEIRLQGDSALEGGEMLDNGYYGLLYDAAYDGAAGGFILLNPATSNVDAATTGAAGIVELATQTEAATLTDTSRAITADGLFFLGGYTTTATAAGTTTLTVTSTFRQIFTGSTTQTVVLPVTSTLVLGRTFRVINNSTGAVTVQSSGANNILVVPPGAVVEFVCILTSGTTAASWDAKNVRGGIELLTSGTVSSAAQLDIPLTTYTGYRGILVKLINFIPATDNVALWVRMSTDGGSSFAAASGYYYGIDRVFSDGVTAASAANNAAQIVAALGVGNGSDEGVSATIEMMGQTSTALKTRIAMRASTYDATNLSGNMAGTGYYNTAQDTDALRFLMSSGNIASGSYAVYGYV